MADRCSGEVTGGHCCGVIAHRADCPLVRWAAASVAAFDEACPLSGDDYFISAEAMNAWRDARHACERAERTADSGSEPGPGGPL